MEGTIPEVAMFADCNSRLKALSEIMMPAKEKTTLAGEINAEKQRLIQQVMIREVIPAFEARILIGDRITRGETEDYAAKEVAFGPLRQVNGETHTLPDGIVIPIFRRVKPK